MAVEHSTFVRLGGADLRLGMFVFTAFGNHNALGPLSSKFSISISGKVMII